jgi:hypothetical protein
MKALYPPFVGLLTLTPSSVRLEIATDEAHVTAVPGSHRPAAAGGARIVARALHSRAWFRNRR